MLEEAIAEQDSIDTTTDTSAEEVAEAEVVETDAEDLMEEAVVLIAEAEELLAAA